MNIPQLMQLIHRRKHLTDIKPRMLLLQHPRVIQQRPEITPRNILHRQIHTTRILKRIKQPHQPLRLRRRQNIPLHQHVSNLIHLEQRGLHHLLQRADFACLAFTSEVDLAVAALPDLGDDVELIDVELGASAAEDDALATAVGFEFFGILGGGDASSGGVFVEPGSAIFARCEVAEGLEVIVQEDWSSISPCQWYPAIIWGLTKLSNSRLSLHLRTIQQLPLPQRLCALTHRLIARPHLGSLHVDVVAGGTVVEPSRGMHVDVGESVDAAGGVHVDVRHRDGREGL